MTANELRIGNLIYNNYKEFKYVVGTSYKKILYSSNMENFTYNECYDFDCEPIPLTEEWLLKFGFLFDEEEIVFKKQDLIIELIDGNFMFNYFFGLTYLKHVHQLQNLYFALTQNELTIK